MKYLVHIIVWSLTAASLAAQGLVEIASFYGTASARSGRAVVLTDTDGDGIDDLVIASDGAVEVLAAASARRLHLFQGSAGEDFGASVAAVGDVDGDGAGDIAIGAPGAHGGDGLVQLRSGLTGTVLATWNGTGGERLGATVAGAGDVDGDGCPDVAAASRPLAGFSGQHRVRVFSTASGAELSSATSPDLLGGFGFAIASGSDWDGDGHPDLVVGAPDEGGHSGALHFVSAATGSIIGRWAGWDWGGRLGADVAVVGDVDGDGLDEVAATAAGGVFGAPVRVYLFSGATLEPMWWYAVPAPPFAIFSSPFAPRLAALGDIDGDGRRELAVSTTVGVGAIEIMDLARGETRLRIEGALGDVFAGFGAALAAGDADGDGARELVVATPLSSNVAPSGGRVVVLRSNAPLPVLPDRPVFLESFGVGGATAGARMGQVIEVIDDADGDGVKDLAVGAPATQSSAAAPFVDVRSGVTGQLISRIPGAVGSDLGASLAALPDLDGDGLGELLVGAPGVGEVHVVSTATGLTLTTLSGGPAFGRGAAVLTDVSGAPPMLAVSEGNGQVRLFAVDGTAIGTAAAFGAVVCSVGDLDGDGHDDLAVADPSASGTAGAAAGRVTVLSGGAGPVLFTIEGDAAAGAFGSRVVPIPEIDGDGSADLVVLAAGLPGSSSYVMVVSGATGAMIRRVALAGAGGDLVALSSIDDDGIADFAVGVGETVSIRSGASGAELLRLDDGPLSSGFGHALAAADLDGDGLAEIVVGRPFATCGGLVCGGFRQYRRLLAPLPVQVPAALAGEAARGRVGVGHGGPYAVLRVQGEAGGADRTVAVGAGEAVTLSLVSPPHDPTPGDLVIIGRLGLPAADDGLDLGSVGALVVTPAPLVPSSPDHFVLASPIPGSGLLPGGSTPWAVTFPAGLPPVTMTLQALIVVGSSSWAATNAVVLASH